MAQHKDKRELRQLWFVSDMYFDLAQAGQPPEDLLELTVGAFAKRCESPEPFKENEKKLIRATAHLNSCAVRLYSIEECIKSTRYTKYDEIRKLKDKSEVRKEIEGSLDQCIHFLLRHMVAHCESKRSEPERFKDAYETMYVVFMELKFSSIFDAMEAAMRLVESDAT